MLKSQKNHPVDKELVVRTVDSMITSFESASRERAMKLLRFYQLLSCFDSKLLQTLYNWIIIQMAIIIFIIIAVNFVVVFTAKGGYEALNKLLLKWNDEEFLTHIVIVLGSTIMCTCLDPPTDGPVINFLF